MSKKKEYIPDYVLEALDNALKAKEEDKRKKEIQDQRQKQNYEKHLLSEKRKEERWKEWFESRPEAVIKAEFIIQWINNKIFKDKDLMNRLISLKNGQNDYFYGNMEFYEIFSYYTGREYRLTGKEVNYIAIFPKLSKIKINNYSSGLFGRSRDEADISSSRDMVRYLSLGVINKLYNHIRSGTIWESLR